MAKAKEDNITPTQLRDVLSEAIRLGRAAYTARLGLPSTTLRRLGGCNAAPVLLSDQRLPGERRIQKKEQVTK